MEDQTVAASTEKRTGRPRIILRLVVAGALLVGISVLLLIVLWKHFLSNTFGSPTGERGAYVESAPSIIFDFGEITQEWNAPAPWRSRSIIGSIDVQVESHNDVSGNVLRVKSNQSHYIIWDQTRTYNPKDYPVLAWSWCAIELPTRGSVLTHDKFYFSSANLNDKGLQVLVGFEGRKALMYAWDSTAPVDTEVFEKSPVAKIATRIVDSGNSQPGEWRHHQLNIYDDYVRRFGEEPGLVLGVAIQTNSNHTATSSEGLISPIEARPSVE